MLRNLWPGTVAHACNLSCLEGGDQESYGLRPAQAKSSQDPISTNKKLGMMVLTCYSSHAGSIFGGLESGLTQAKM
jgi:hypothetical protein